MGRNAHPDLSIFYLCCDALRRLKLLTAIRLVREDSLQTAVAFPGIQEYQVVRPAGGAVQQLVIIVCLFINIEQYLAIDFAVPAVHNLIFSIDVYGISINFLSPVDICQEILLLRHIIHEKCIGGVLIVDAGFLKAVICLAVAVLTGCIFIFDSQICIAPGLNSFKIEVIFPVFRIHTGHCAGTGITGSCGIDREACGLR